MSEKKFVLLGNCQNKKKLIKRDVIKRSERKLSFFWKKKIKQKSSDKKNQLINIKKSKKNLHIF